MSWLRWLARVMLSGALLAGGAGAQGLPDLYVDAARLAADVGITLRTFLPDDCALQATDLCVGAPGGRKLLRFTTSVVNAGAAPLVAGPPSLGDPRFEWSECHGHFHFLHFSRYELRRRGESTVVAAGHKQSFCLEDQQAVADPHGPAQFRCTDQGLSVGWADPYDSTLDCQWIDVTDVPPGDYDLTVVLNPERVIAESDYADDVTAVPVTLAAPVRRPPTVHVRAPRASRRFRTGDPVRVAWRRNGRAAQLQELWVSRDGGGTFAFVALLPPIARRATWIVPAGPATDRAVARVVVWSSDLQRAAADGAPFGLDP